MFWDNRGNSKLTLVGFLLSFCSVPVVPVAQVFYRCFWNTVSAYCYTQQIYYKCSSNCNGCFNSFLRYVLSCCSETFFLNFAYMPPGYKPTQNPLWSYVSSGLYHGILQYLNISPQALVFIGTLSFGFKRKFRLVACLS